jgi:hypothetical protein
MPSPGIVLGVIFVCLALKITFWVLLYQHRQRIVPEDEEIGRTVTLKAFENECALRRLDDADSGVGFDSEREADEGKKAVQVVVMAQSDERDDAPQRDSNEQEIPRRVSRELEETREQVGEVKKRRTIIIECGWEIAELDGGFVAFELDAQSTVAEPAVLKVIKEEIEDE